MTNVNRLSPVEIDHKQAKQAWQAFRVSEGYAPNASLLGEPGSNVKTTKNDLPTYTLSLAAAYHGTCPFSTEQCREVCLVKVGRGGEPSVGLARKLRVRFLESNPDAFCTLVKVELLAAVAKHGAIGCRLNTFSDIAWERVAPWMLAIPRVTFYDYTKDWTRTGTANYSLTLSASERTSDDDIRDAVDRGRTVAVVMSIKHRPGAKVQNALPDRFLGRTVIDGDKTDERFAERGVIVGLRAKGKAALLPVGGFVRQAI